MMLSSRYLPLARTNAFRPFRTLCTATTGGTGDGSDSAAAPPTPVGQGNRKDTAYVQRRYGWRDALRGERVAFMKGDGLGAAEAARKLEQAREPKWKKKPVDPAKVQARLEKKVVRYRAHVEMLAEVQREKEPRQAAKRAIWEQRQAALAASQAQLHADIESAAQSWITENNLDDAVDRCVDAFFSGSDAHEHAVRAANATQGA